MLITYSLFWGSLQQLTLKLQLYNCTSIPDVQDTSTISIQYFKRQNSARQILCVTIFHPCHYFPWDHRICTPGKNVANTARYRCYRCCSCSRYMIDNDEHSLKTLELVAMVKNSLPPAFINVQHPARICDTMIYGELNTTVQFLATVIWSSHLPLPHYLSCTKSLQKTEN